MSSGFKSQVVIGLIGIGVVGLIVAQRATWETTQASSSALIGITPPDRIEPPATTAPATTTSTPSTTVLVNTTTTAPTTTTIPATTVPATTIPPPTAPPAPVEVQAPPPAATTPPAPVPAPAPAPQPTPAPQPAPALTPAPQPAAVSGSASSAAIDAANAERVAAGLAALQSGAALNSAAVTHSIDQASHNTMTHTGSDGSNAGTRLARAGFSASTWGENVAAGYTSAASVVSGWMGSSGHRDNILNPNFTYIGVAYAQANDGTLYWTMVLAA